MISNQQKKIRIGLLGGSFDPIHHGHLHLALLLKEIHQLDEVWLIPTGENPLKQNRNLTPFADRVAMAKIAIAPLKGFTVNEIESHLPFPSYTIDTLRALTDYEKKGGREKEFFLLMGEDLLPELPLWKQIDQLAELVPFLIGSRSHKSFFSDKTSLAPFTNQAIQKGFTEIPLLDISSTFLRNRLCKRIYCGHLIPTAVLDYIKHHQLYL